MIFPSRPFPSPAQTTIRYLSYTPPLLLIARVLYLHYHGLSPSAVIADWLTWRNYLYLGYAVVLVFLGLVIVLRRAADPHASSSIPGFVVPAAILSLILTAFSYTTANAIINLLARVRPGI